MPEEEIRVCWHFDDHEGSGIWMPSDGHLAALLATVERQNEKHGEGTHWLERRPVQDKAGR